MWQRLISWLQPAKATEAASASAVAPQAPAVDADQPPELAKITDKDGEEIEVKFDSTYVAWMKLRVDTRKWTAARMAPKKYGEYKQPEEKVDPMIIDVEVENLMDAAIHRLEMIRTPQ